VGNPEDPARKPARRVEAREITKCLEERLLRDVFGERRIANDPRDQVVRRTLVPADDLVEGGLGSAQRQRDELRVREALQVDRDNRS
jgi:hypothetical protein